MGSRSTALIWLGCAALIAVPASAAEIVWGGGDGTFGTAANWIGGVAPGSSDTASFSGWMPLVRSGWMLSASSTDGGAPLNNSKDGRLTTRWASGAYQASGHWFKVDVGSSQSFSRVDIDAGPTYPNDAPVGYTLSVSTDDSSYTAVATGAGTPGLTTITFPSQTARYIKITLTGSSMTNWWGIAEIEVYGRSAETELSRNGWTASASVSDGASPASNAVDNSLTTKWATGALQANGQWFKVDMGANQTFTAFIMDAYSTTSDYPRAFTLAVSTNDSSYTDVATGVTIAKEYIQYTFASQTARYIRITQTGSSGTNWWSIHDFKVYGTPATATLGASATLAGLTLAKSTLAQGSGNTLTVSGDFTQSAGTFTGGNSLVSVGGNFNLSGGTHTATSGLLQIAGAFNKTGGTFTHSSGRVLLNATSSKTFATDGATFNSVYVNDGLIGYWKLDDSASPAVDYSGWGRDATWMGSATSSATVASTNFANPRSLSVPTGASTDYARFTSPAAPVITIAAWVRATAAGGGGLPRVVAMPGYQVYLDTNSLGFYFISSRATTAGNWRTPVAFNLAYGTWYHVAVSYDSTSTTNDPIIYVNGVSQTPVTENTGPAGAAISNEGNYGYIGNRSTADRYWNGVIDDLRIYDRILSAAEIADLYGGQQRTTPVGTQTLSGALTTAADLVLASGTLDVSASACSAAPCDVTVGGNWHNLGGAFTPRTGTVSFNGTGGSNVLLSDRVPFYNLTVSNTGTWTLQDRLDVDGIISISANGTLAQSSSNYTIRAGTLNKTTGTISGSGSLVLDAASDRSLTVNSLSPGLRIESPLDSSLIGYWKLDEGRGTTAYDVSGNGYNGTVYNSAIWSSSIPSSVPIDDAGSLALNGSNQYVRVSRNTTLEPTAVTVAAWVKRSGTQLQWAKVALKTYNNSTSAPYQSYSLQMNDDNADSSKIYFELGLVGGSTAAVASATNALPDGTWTHVVGVYDPAGSAPQHRIYINGVLANSATRTTAMAYDTSANGDLYFGQNGDGHQYFNGSVDDVRIYNRGLGANEVAALYNYGYTTGSTVVYSLAATSSLGSTLKIDSGILDAATYQNSITGATTINGGTYAIGSNSSGQTFTGGLTVNRHGGLTLASANGKVIMGNGANLFMNGTLIASSTSASIQAVASGRYTFSIGNTPTATPTLNITGLQVKDTGSNGMFIGTDYSSVTTITRFDNIAFSNGSGTGAGNYNLRIHANSLVLTSNGCTFDNGVNASVANNVYLAGNGTGDGETRAVFGGAACASNQGSCEAYDSDDDNNATPDGVGDNAGSNGAVVQWVSSAYADTSGSIEGFPTAAFDWSNFSYYATYVAYHDTGGGTADTVYVRSSSGAASYSWSTPSGEDIVGTPRWDTVSGTHYLYVALTSGKVYRLIDNGSSLSPDTVSPWNGANNPYDCSCTITTPLAQDTSNVYWGGSASSTHKIWTLSKTSSSPRLASGSPVATGNSTNNTAPAIWVSGSTYAFLGLTGSVSKFNISTQAAAVHNTNPVGYAVTGRITVIFNKIYAGDDNGSMWCLDPDTNFANPATNKFWSYKDSNHGAGAAAAPIKSHYFDPLNARVYFGDQDGHLYVVNSSGSAVTGYPWRPGTSSDAFATAPFYQAGVIVVGTTGGALYVIDQNSNGSTPAKIQTYQFGSSTAISGVGVDQATQNYLITTANATSKDGKLYRIAISSDPTGSFL